MSRRASSTRPASASRTACATSALAISFLSPSARARTSAQRRRPSSTGVGPAQTASGTHDRLSSSSRRSPHAVRVRRGARPGVLGRAELRALDVQRGRGAPTPSRARARRRRPRTRRSPPSPSCSAASAQPSGFQDRISQRPDDRRVRLELGDVGWRPRLRVISSTMSSRRSRSPVSSRANASWARSSARSRVALGRDRDRAREQVRRRPACRRGRAPAARRRRGSTAARRPSASARSPSGPTRASSRRACSTW